jgi:hypothetical protein
VNWGLGINPGQQTRRKTQAPKRWEHRKTASNLPQTVRNARGAQFSLDFGSDRGCYLVDYLDRRYNNAVKVRRPVRFSAGRQR